ncbi:hypothetical protein Y032_0314g2253 [Ancylostoma ceylanicum]|uniref:GYF domain-containing protein n=1 Tax=Ancylostoma ceylanicum TaxID=53326 RepID=A0A016S302_9BILA|nr:hypothetical protein Y032_0314g2253 [Ancylostoma ceylanicum]
MALFSYIDEENHLRGPFEGVQMHYWYLQGYLQPSLRIFMHQGLFGRPTSLEELMEKNGTSNPFYDTTESTKIEDNPCLKPTSSSPNSFYPFLTGNSSEELDGDKLSVATVEECSARLQLVKSKYNIKHMNGVLEKFGATEKAQQRTYSEGEICELFLLLLSKFHLFPVYNNGRFFSEGDKMKLLEMLDSIERNATAKDVFAKSAPKLKEEEHSQSEVVIEKDAKATETSPTFSPSLVVAPEKTVTPAATISTSSSHADDFSKSAYNVKEEKCSPHEVVPEKDVETTASSISSGLEVVPERAFGADVTKVRSPSRK